MVEALGGFWSLRSVRVLGLSIFTGVFGLSIGGDFDAWAFIGVWVEDGCNLYCKIVVTGGLSRFLNSPIIRRVSFSLLFGFSKGL